MHDNTHAGKKPFLSTQPTLEKQKNNKKTDMIYKQTHTESIQTVTEGQNCTLTQIQSW